MFNWTLTEIHGKVKDLKVIAKSVEIIYFEARCEFNRKRRSL